MTFIAVIGIAFGILQIILFFKIWGMTNDVKKLTEKFTPSGKGNDIWYIRKELLKGNKEKVQELLADEFIQELRLLYGNWAHHSSQFSARLTPLKNRYKYYYEQIGCTFPETLEKINVPSDIANLFNPNFATPKKESPETHNVGEGK